MAARPDRPPILLIADSELFAAAYNPSFPHGGVTFPTRRRLPGGQLVRIRVGLGRRRAPIELCGLVAGCRRAHYLLRIRAALEIELLPSEAAKRDYLLRMAPTRPPGSRRRHERWPVAVPVLWQDGRSARFSGKLLDVGFGGALLRSRTTIRGDELVLQLVPPGAAQAMAIAGRVTWTGKTGRQVGYGIRWVARDRGGENRIRELVQRLACGPDRVRGPCG
jgi:Tfp pilus assembly protein PilZ